jgi:NADH-quinone oxidoreductase subunit C
MDANTLVASLQEAVPAAQIESVPGSDLHATVYVSRDEVPQVARALRDRPELAFDLLADIVGIDVWPKEPRFEVAYILVSTRHRHRLRLKVRLAGQSAHVGTVIGVWPAANWLEREVWDLFGIEFTGHPDPRRLLMPEDWEGFPLRKDYPVQIRLKPTVAAPLQVSEEEFRANVMQDRLTRG